MRIIRYPLDYLRFLIYTECINKTIFLLSCKEERKVAEHDKSSKRVCVTMTEQDHEHLTQLAYETLRTRSGYMRWLLHQDFMKRGIYQKDK